MPQGSMLTLPRTLQLTPAQFAEVCAAHLEAVLELDADGTLIKSTPTGGSTCARNQLPLKLFDSSTASPCFLAGCGKRPEASASRPSPPVAAQAPGTPVPSARSRWFDPLIPQGPVAR